MRVLRLIKGVTKRDRLRNVDIQNELDVEPITTFIEQAQLRWYGHVMRMEPNKHPNRYYKWVPRGSRPRGRPRKRWKDGVSQAMVARGETIRNVEENELYWDRTGWRSFVRHHN